MRTQICRMQSCIEQKPMLILGWQEVTVNMTNFNTIIDDIFPLADKTEYINALVAYQLLIIDDLGVERNSEYALGIIFNL